MFAIEITKAVFEGQEILDSRGKRLDGSWIHLDIDTKGPTDMRVVTLRFKVRGSDTLIDAECHVDQGRPDSWYYTPNEEDRWESGNCIIKFPHTEPDRVMRFECELRGDKIEVKSV